MEMEAGRLVYTVAELGKRMGLSRPSAYKAIRQGAVPFIRVGRRILIPRQALENFLANAGQPVATK